jgi:hypothetical protein
MVHGSGDTMCYPRRLVEIGLNKMRRMHGVWPIEMQRTAACRIYLTGYHRRKDGECVMGHQRRRHSVIEYRYDGGVVNSSAI